MKYNKFKSERTASIITLAVLLIILSTYYLFTFDIHGLSIIEYCKTRYALRNEKIIVSISTTPYRINKLRPTLNTLFKQNMRIDNIYISVPHVFKRDNIKYEIPKWLADEKRVTILRTEDYGPATKLFGLLEKVNLPNETIIITVDDDIFYPPNLVLVLAQKAIEYPNSAIGLAGVDIDYDENRKIRGPGHGVVSREDADGKVMIVLGYAGIAYRYGFFDETIFVHKNAPKECYVNDDLYIGFYLEKNGFPRRKLKNPNLSLIDIRNNEEVGWQEDALFKLTPNRAETNAICIDYMKSQSPGVNF